MGIVKFSFDKRFKCEECKNHLGEYADFNLKDGKRRFICVACSGIDHLIMDVFKELSDNPKDCEKCKNQIKEYSVKDLNFENYEKRIICVACAGIDHLSFLPSGDQCITTRAQTFSSVYYPILVYSKRFNRNLRAGTLVEAQAIDKARESCEKDKDKRTASALRRREKREAQQKGERLKDDLINGNLTYLVPVHKQGILADSMRLKRKLP
jgi:hypothetical protein